MRQFVTCICAGFILTGVAAAELLAQTLPYPVPATAKVAWDHPGPLPAEPLLRFELQVDTGPQADLGVPVALNAAVCGDAPKPLCTYEAAFPAVQPGTRVLKLRACNEAGCSEPATATVNVFVSPVSPTQLRIVIGGQ